MKKPIKILLLLVICSIITTVIVVIIKKINKEWPEENVYSSENDTMYTDDGLYFFKYGILTFLDSKSGQTVPVCTRPNCKHAGEKCEAYYDDIAPRLLVYSDKIFVSSFNVEFDDNDDYSSESYSRLEVSDINGENRKSIYSADTGAVIDIIAIDGKVYFTAYVFKNGFEMNTYYNEFKLYSYDIAWGKTKELLSFTADDSHYNAGVEIIASQDKNTLHLIYEYSDGKYEGADATTHITQLIDYNIADKTTKETDLPDNIWVRPIMSNEEGNFAIIDYDCTTLEDGFTLMSYKDSMKDSEMFLEVDYGALYHFDGYFYIIKSDYEKVLYDYREDKWYAANTTFTKEGNYIPDIIDVDRNNNVIYFDATDYTGYQPGDLLPGDISSKTCGKWDAFLSKNFTEYSELSDEQLSEIDWIRMGN